MGTNTWDVNPNYRITHRTKPVKFPEGTIHYQCGIRISREEYPTKLKSMLEEHFKCVVEGLYNRIKNEYGGEIPEYHELHINGDIGYGIIDPFTGESEVIH